MPVCVGPGRKPNMLIFPCESSFPFHIASGRSMWVITVCHWSPHVLSSSRNLWHCHIGLVISTSIYLLGTYSVLTYSYRYSRGLFENVSDNPGDTEQFYEPVHEKTNNLGFRPGPKQTRLCSDSIKLEA